MKVRLYRGPQDGKVYDIDPTQNVIVVSAVADPSNLYQYGVDAGDTYPMVGLNTVQCFYKRTKHTHPDGSVFFEWDKPRGTKSGVRPRRSRRKTKTWPTQVYINTGTNWQSIGYTNTTGITVP